MEGRTELEGGCVNGWKKFPRIEHDRVIGKLGGQSLTMSLSLDIE